MAEVIPEVLGGVLRTRPTMVEVREFRHQRWRLNALAQYCDLLVRVAERQGLTEDLADRIERAIAEADRAQLWLDQRADAMAA